MSPLLTKPQIQKQFEYLEATVKEAQKRIDLKVATNPDVIKAIEIVERFLRKRKRVCYGGQAINSLLPKAKKFYDEKYDVPDYDFFTPNSNGDVEELISMLEKEGFSEVNKKVGIHEGTIKVYVNYIPVADCSQMNPHMFRILQKRAKEVDGVYYCDPDYLRMMMYLELSRPRGEVDRWKKVFERLTLLNHEYPPSTFQGKGYECSEEVRVSKNVDYEDRKHILDFCQKHKRVIVGSEVVRLFEEYRNKVKMEDLVRIGGPVLFMSEKAMTDAEDLKEILGSMREREGVRIHKTEVASDSLFNYVTIKRGSKPIGLIFQIDACHSYTSIMAEGDEIRIGHPDLLLHLYYGLMIFGKKEKEYFETSFDCLIKKLHSVLKTSRNKPSKFLPAFGLRCSGRQKGLATLLREKQERVKKEKEKVKSKSKTRKIRKNE
jgi:hypothetical protein